MEIFWKNFYKNSRGIFEKFLEFFENSKYL